MRTTAFRRAWNGRAVEDWATGMSPSAIKFANAFKNYIRKSLLDTRTYLHTGHYYISGFIVKGKTIEYISYDIPRWGRPIDFDKTGYAEGVLYRTARDLKDYTGGKNNYTSIEELPIRLKEVFEGA